MKRLVVQSRFKFFQHAILPRQPFAIASGDFIPNASPVEICSTRVGEPICACGHYILEWEAARRFGQSQATDGANR